MNYLKNLSSKNHVYQSFKLQKHKKILLAVSLFVVLLLLIYFALQFTNLPYAKQASAAIKEENFDYVGSEIYTNENRNLSTENISILRPDGDLKDYIKSNINNSLSSFTSYNQCSAINVKQTLVDETKISSNPTLDSIWFSDNTEAFISMYDNPVVLYNLDNNSDYAVGYVNTMAGKINDFAFAENNYDGKKLNDCIYERETGLIYIPKTYLNDKTISTQMQTVISVLPDDDFKVANCVNVSVNIENGTKISKQLTPNCLDTELQFPVGCLDKDNVIVIANDEQDVTNQCTYDGYNLTLNMAPVNIRSLSVMSGSNTASESSLSDEKSMNMLPSDRFKLNDSKISPQVGACVESPDYIQYWEQWSGGSPSWYTNCLYGPNGFNSDADMANFKSVVWDGNGSIDLNTLSISNTYIMMAMYTWDICDYQSQQEGVWNNPDCLPLKCGHIGTPASTGPDNSQRSRILAINAAEGYAVIGICSKVQGLTNQGGCGTFKVAYDSYGGFNLQKNSTYEWSLSNSNYSLGGTNQNVTHYDVWDSESSMKSYNYKDGHYVGTVNLNQVSDSGQAYGFSNDSKARGVLTENSLNLHANKTYFIRESQMYHGTNYLLNADDYATVSIEANKWNKAVKFHSFSNNETSDTPAYDNLFINIAKSDAQLLDTKSTQGNATFNNAQYEYKFYTKIFTKIQDVPAEYTKHWIMQTNNDGVTNLLDGNSKKVSGDEFYYADTAEKPVCPIGTYVVKEKQSPLGYELPDITYIFNVVEDSKSKYGATTKAYYGCDCDTYIKDSKGVINKVHHRAGDEITMSSNEVIIDSQTGMKTLKAQEQVKRGDFNFDKQATPQNFENKRLSRIPFKITSKTTGEWHVVVTDDNACVNSSADNCKHTINTNYFDCLLDVAGNLPKEGINENLIDDFYNISGNQAGVWFCYSKEFSEYTKGKTIRPIDDNNLLCALPFDTYTLEELPVTKNNPYSLITQDFCIDRSNVNVDLGTITNVPKVKPTISTYASSENGDKNIDVNTESAILDNVGYKDVIAGDNYTLKSWVVDAQTENIVSDVLSTSFTPENDSGQVEINISIDTTNLKGKKLTYYEELYNEDSELIADHKICGDTNQSVVVKNPSVKTYLYDLNSQKTLKERTTAQGLVDYVEYSNLMKDTDYSIHHEIKRQETLDNLTCGDTSFRSSDTGFGTTKVEIVCDTTQLNNNDALVAYEYVYKDDVLIAQHTDPLDSNQIVRLSILQPSISTYASDVSNISKEINITDKATVKDKVNYVNLETAFNYKLESTLVDKATGKVVIDNGNEVKTIKEFVPSAPSGYEEVYFYFDSRLFQGKTLVCYEKLYMQVCGAWEICATHEDINDIEQTVYIKQATCSTNLHVIDSTSHIAPRSKNVNLIDDVLYQGLTVGDTYIINAKLVNTDGTDFIDSTGNKVSYSGSFSANDTGKTYVSYNFDTSNIADGIRAISFIDIKSADIDIVAHKDLNDPAQTITITLSPIEISTSARGGTSQTKELYCISSESVIDAVNYHGAESGYEYKLRAQLIDKATGEAILPLNASDGTTYVEKKFIANEKGYGTEEIQLNVDTRLLQDKSLVVFEELFDHTGVCRATHQDINDFEQTVKTNQPKIETDLYQKSDNSQNVQRYVEQHLIDKVTYRNLCPGCEYELSAVLVCKDTGKIYINEITESPVVANVAFIPETSDGSIDKLEYIFDSTLLPIDCQLVSYVTMMQNNGQLLEHKILDDKRETVKIVTPTLQTNIYDPDTGYKSFVACRQKTINDDYSWSNLPKDRVVQAYNWLVNYDTGYPVTDSTISQEDANNTIRDLVESLGGEIVIKDTDSKQARWNVVFDNVANKVDIEKLALLDLEKLSHIAFTSNELPINADKGKSTVQMVFNYGNTPAQKCVAMSVIVSENTTIANHIDIEDSHESIEITRSNITTELKDINGNKTTNAGTDTILIDYVLYNNCIIGKEYELEGQLIDKRNGSVVSTNKVKFVPDTASGDTSISFQLNTSNLVNADLVAYEYLYLDGDLAAKHTDIDDKSQTVHINNIAQSALSNIGSLTKTSTSKTGDSLYIMFLLLILGSVVAITFILLKSNKHYQDDIDVDKSNENSKESVEELAVNLEFSKTNSLYFEDEIDLSDNLEK